MSCAGRGQEQPSKRHGHSAVVHAGHMWVYGGQTDLQEKSDFWKWTFATRTWTKIKPKANKGPGGVHGHTAVKSAGAMILFGGEREGQLLHELWRFHFGEFRTSLVPVFSDTNRPNFHQHRKRGSA